MKTKKTPPDNPIYSAGEKTQQLLRFFRSKKRIQQRNRTVKQTKPGTKADRQEGHRTGKKASGQAGKPQDRQEGLRTGRKASGQAGGANLTKKRNNKKLTTSDILTTDLPTTAGIAGPTPAADGWTAERQLRKVYFVTTAEQAAYPQFRGTKERKQEGNPPAIIRREV
ncbi:hypothetical protein [Thiolapillus sp.]|uniref:hypothetical protein n=1 Tax=Thiolapillus sp. TaxID=2017437 RepID=UPI003AF55D23